MALSSSTTETTTYMLEKYSRAYFPKKDSGGSEWQHFTNPILRLILDSKLSPERTDSSLRLRIIWTMNGGAASGGTQDVVLEDLDLLAFSSLKDKSESSPLKGVYRDTTFGLRYLHVPDSTDSQKVYRRFQVSFATPAVALQLVNAIRDVCPCKVTEPPNANALERKKTIAVSTAIAAPARVPPAQIQDAVLPRPHPHFGSSLAPAFTQQPQRMPPVVTVTMTDALMPMSSPALLSLLSSQPQPDPLGFSSSPAGAPAPGPSPSYDPPPFAASASTFQNQNHLTKPALRPSSFPDSSPPPPSSADSVMMPPPSHPPRLGANVNINANNVEMGAEMAAALREATGLYDLPRAALERLVGDVVREDGFVGLLEKVSSMWAMKAVVGT
ncbi:hypothetical protein B0H19DRAFT_1082183 [Mycena capillaripes]|nr:hypothetical protein B0H19DRAFT_1082183 [Mycena capillaripes]